MYMVQVVEAGDWIQVTVQFTKLSMHVSVSPTSAVGRRMQRQHAQPEPQNVWEEELAPDMERSSTGESEAALRDSSRTNESQVWRRRNDWVGLEE